MNVEFRKTLMLGRQHLFPDAKCLQRIFDIQKINLEASKFLAENLYGEKFFSLLGAQEIDSIDYSDYEEATIVHDMNLPIPGELRERFSVVYDGGTLEHVFNIPQALKNSMEMVEIGGHFLQANIANNFVGHGFWQFSPELLFRVFAPENGFQTEMILLHEGVPGGKWYSVSDPNEVRQRVTLCNSKPTYIMTIARKVASVEIFATPPLQSDYSATWEQIERKRAEADLNPQSEDKSSAHKNSWRKLLPAPVERILRPAYQMFQSLVIPFHGPFYRKILEDDLLRGTAKLKS